ncbi:MAG: CerR family C-terminal domain-containing protein [Methylococcaceae bacterium]|nr:CerR family C-terminal domain-containing protein [Methylococcaceae bacterium]
MSNALSSDVSRDRLLVAAVEIFAERGFRDATVREICARAEVNAASVNYYFGGKENLYAEALVYAFEQGETRHPAFSAQDSTLPAEERLRSIITNMLYRVTDDSHLGCQGKLITREIVNPTKALDHIVETILRPRFQILREILPQLLGPGFSHVDISRCILSIIGQCLMYRHSRSLVERLCPETIANAEEIDRTADSIVRFSLAALRGLAKERGD